MTAQPAIVVDPATAALIAAGAAWVGGPSLGLTCPVGEQRTYGPQSWAYCARTGFIITSDDKRCIDCRWALPHATTGLLLVDTASNVWGVLHDAYVLPVRTAGSECHVISDHICIDGDALVHVSQYDEGSPDVSDEAAGTWAPGGHAIHADTFTSVSTPGGCPACDGEGCIGGWVAEGGTICWLCHGYHRLDGPFRAPGAPNIPCITTIDLEDQLNP